MKKPSNELVLDLNLSLIDEPPRVARREINAADIKELGDSIKAIGLLQPILVRPMGGRYEIIAGHRRFLAHVSAGLTKIRCLSKTMTDQEAALARATENLGRVDLTPLEEAEEYYDLINVHGLTVETVGQKFGKTPGTIKRRMDILKMPPILQDAVHSGRVSISAAEELWPISDLTQLEYYLTFAVENGCTKEVARQWCHSWRDSVRRDSNPGVESGGAVSPLAPRPIYVSCDLCAGPIELEKAVRMTICTACHTVIKSNM